MNDRDERAEWLAEQLRANLKRRKAQARAAADAPAGVAVRAPAEGSERDERS